MTTHPKQPILIRVHVNGSTHIIRWCEKIKHAERLVVVCGSRNHRAGWAVRR